MTELIKWFENASIVNFCFGLILVAVVIRIIKEILFSD